MKILILTPDYAPSVGGVEVATKLLVDELSRRGHHIVIVTTERKDAQSVETGDTKIFRLRDFPLKLDPWRSYFFIKQNLKIILKIIHDEEIEVINVVHFDRSYPFTFILKKNLDLPIITTVHVTWFADPIYRKFRFTIKEPFRRVLRLYPGMYMDRKSIKNADMVITISKHLEASIRCFRKNRIITIPNAIDLTKFNPGVSPAKIDCDGYRILCTGRLSPEKGQMFLIEAMRIVVSSVNAHLFLLGSSNGNEIDKLQKIVSKYGLEKRVHFISPIPYDEVPSYYKAMDLIVQPSLSESFGIAILENMALGNVVIASEVGGIPELIEDGKTGLLVPPGNSKILGEKIIEILKNQSLQSYIKNNTTIKSKKYDIIKNAHDFENVIFEVIQMYQ
jgi:glycosyltransferase involved in cell wall biosynthesis